MCFSFCFPFSLFLLSFNLESNTPTPIQVSTSDVMFAKGSSIWLQCWGLDPMSSREGQRWGPGSSGLGERSFPYGLMLGATSVNSDCLLWWLILKRELSSRKAQERRTLGRRDCPPCWKHLFGTDPSSPRPAPSHPF